MRNTVVTFILALIPLGFAHAQIPAAERDALIALYNSSDGANWSNSSNWLGAVGTECTWYGVTCAGGHVQHLNLAANQLNGSIPTELEYLSSLIILDLNSNLLSGSIPPELGNLPILEELWLHFNSLTGSIPPELGDLSSLKILSLRSNLLDGTLPVELGKLSSLVQLSLSANQLTGSIPQELGDLSNLLLLYLSNNQLSGSIPPELGNLSLLEVLFLNINQLTGSIPGELGSLSSLLQLRLQINRLSGSIPSTLGGLSNLERLYLYSNRLNGSIPTELENLSSLLDGDGLRIRWNALHSDNASLIAFLNSKQEGGDWQSTQTIAPENLTVDSVSDRTAWLSWDAVSYQSDPGGYSVFSAPTGSGVWTSHGWTEAKTTTTFPVTGLDPGTTYDLAVISYTDPHVDNFNLVNSDFSPEEMVTTTSGGCAEPAIEIEWGDPITLSVPGSWDSYLWITGETTPTIDITPVYDQWYWVTVTSTGPCEETGAVWVDPTTPIFLDGFESGSTTEWSSAVP